LNILEMGRKELFALPVWKVREPLSAEEIFHIANIAGALWSYNYDLAEIGNVGLHAEIKSGRHTDQALNSRFLFQTTNVRRIMAYQIAMCLDGRLSQSPDYVAGIPNGATGLCKDLAWILGAKEAEMKKCNGGIHLVTEVGAGTVLLADDFFSVGTGVTEAALEIHRRQPKATIVKYIATIVNRGARRIITVEDVGIFHISAVAEKRVQDWDPLECPLCDRGSRPIKFKETDENWNFLINSQK